MKQFGLKAENHSATFTRFMQQGQAAEERYRSFFMKGGEGEPVAYQLEKRDIDWVVGVLEDSYRKNPPTESTENSIDTLVELWHRIQATV